MRPFKNRPRRQRGSAPNFLPSGGQYWSARPRCQPRRKLCRHRTRCRNARHAARREPIVELLQGSGIVNAANGSCHPADPPISGQACGCSLLESLCSGSSKRPRTSGRPAVRTRQYPSRLRRVSRRSCKMVWTTAVRLYRKRLKRNGWKILAGRRGFEPDKQIQRLSCYRYTTSQSAGILSIGRESEAEQTGWLGTQLQMPPGMAARHARMRVPRSGLCSIVG